MSEAVKGYIAGMIDGEGCIQLVLNRNRRVHEGLTYVPTLSIYNTNREVLEWIKEQLGMGRVYLSKRERPPRKAQYVYMVKHNLMGKVLMEVKDYLRLKREHAELALKAIEILDKRHHSSWRETREFGLEELHKIHARLRELNGRYHI
jgi:hypothetical protein